MVVAPPSGALPAQALAQLPTQLREDLLGAFQEIVRNYSQHRWEPAELNGGKLSEVAYCICEGLATGTMPTHATKPKNMVDACRALERLGSAPKSVRIQIPRMLVALYEVRNNRGVGHVGGDVDPNHMDAVCVLQMAKWVVAELVRVCHGLSPEDASSVVDALVEREVPLVWKVGKQRRVLDTALSMRDKTLLLLHGCTGAVAEADLVGWVEHRDLGNYRRDVLRWAHGEKLVEYDEAARTVLISPRGIERVEDQILAA